MERSSNYTVPKGKDKVSVWDDLSKKIVDKSVVSIKRVNSLSIIYKVAAAAIIIVFSSIAYFYSDSNYSTKYAETQEIILPDGSNVFLQADSKISFNEKQWKTKREIKLNGEAYFSVKNTIKSLLVFIIITLFNYL